MQKQPSYTLTKIVIFRNRLILPRTLYEYMIPIANMVPDYICSADGGVPLAYECAVKTHEQNSTAKH